MSELMYLLINTTMTSPLKSLLRRPEAGPRVLLR